MPRKQIDLSKFLSEELIAKYEFFVKSDFPTTANMSVDSFFPKLFNEKIKRRGILSSALKQNASSFAISEFVANTMEVRRAHVSELCDVLGYTGTEVKRIILDAKRKNFNLFLVGFGGTGTNFNYWMRELCNWTNTVNVFNTIYVSDNDMMSLSNTVRIPFDYRTKYGNISKNQMFDNSANICKSVIPTIGGTNAKTTAEARVSSGEEKQIIFYGAPDLATRRDLTEIEGCRFVSATHSGDECQLYLNHPQDDSIQIETYGKINLSVFFMNHLQMTINFLEFLQQATDESFKMSAEIATFDFKKKYNDAVEAGTQLGTGRLYRFPCLTREESEALESRNNAELQAETTQPVESTTSEPRAVARDEWGYPVEDGYQSETTPLGSWDQLTDDVLDEIISGRSIDEILEGVR